MAEPSVPCQEITANPSSVLDGRAANEWPLKGSGNIEGAMPNMNMMSSVDIYDASPLQKSTPDQARALNDQIAHLDAVASTDRDDYAWAWLSEVGEAGATALLAYDRDGQKSIQVGCACDEHLEERLRRTKVLATHMDIVEGGRTDVIRLLEFEYPTRVLDLRPKDLRKTVAVLRAFLAAGHKLRLDREGRVLTGASLGRDWMKAGRTRQIEIEKAARAYIELREKLHTDRYLKRIIRALGKHHDGSGCMVLEGSAA